jgi:hypothetical protein
MNTDEDIVDILRKSLCRRYVTLQSPCFHKRAESLVIDDLKRVLILSDPADVFSPRRFQDISLLGQQENN